MNLNNWGAPVAGSTGAVDHILGKAYPVVREVALKIHLINALVPRLDIVEKVATDIVAVRNVAKNIAQFMIIDQKLGTIDEKLAQSLLILGRADEYVAAANTAASRSESAALSAQNSASKLGKALLVYPDLAAAQADAPTLPDGQTVIVESQEKSYKMDDGELSSPKSYGLGGVDPVAFYTLAKS